MWIGESIANTYCVYVCWRIQRWAKPESFFMKLKYILTKTHFNWFITTYKEYSGHINHGLSGLRYVVLSQHCHLLTIWLWAIYLTSLSGLHYVVRDYFLLSFQTCNGKNAQLEVEPWLVGFHSWLFTPIFFGPQFPYLWNKDI